MLATILLTRETIYSSHIHRFTHPMTFWSTSSSKARRCAGGLALSSLPLPAPQQEELPRARARRRLGDRAMEIGLPLVMFLFRMPSDDAFYTWLLEPGIEQGAATLRQNQAMVVERLATEELNAIVTAVDTWYDARGFPLPQLSDRPSSGRQVLQRIIDGRVRFS